MTQDGPCVLTRFFHKSVLVFDSLIYSFATKDDKFGNSPQNPDVVN